MPIWLNVTEFTVELQNMCCDADTGVLEGEGEGRGDWVLLGVTPSEGEGAAAVTRTCTPVRLSAWFGV
jgi:hypothetical protein